MGRINHLRRRRRTLVIQSAVACGAAVACILMLSPVADQPASARERVTEIISGSAAVVDGDGLRISGARIRLHGIDAFERGQTCGDLACGRISAGHLDQLTRGAEVRCTPLDVDRYGRTIARCTARGVDLGAAQVAAGHALAYRRYSLEYVPLEDEARRARRGAWATDFTPPDAWRRAN